MGQLSPGPQRVFPVTKVSHGNGTPCLSYFVGLPVPSSSWSVGMLVSIVARMPARTVIREDRVLRFPSTGRRAYPMVV